MANPNTRTTLKEYCLRNLGKPVIDINVDDDQVEDRLDEALQYFAQYHYDGIEKVYLKHQITQADVDRAASNETTTGIGSGQPSRLDSCQIAIDKMKKFADTKAEIVAASDAFFPFVDGIEKLVQSGVTAVIQPSGSIRDKEIIKYANETNTILVFSNTRHFRH